jgi:hypothetical protein
MLERKRKKEWKREEKRKEEGEEDEGLEIGRERPSFTTATVSNHNKHLTFYGVHPGNLPHTATELYHSINPSIRQSSHQFFHPMLLLLVSTRLFTALCPFGSIPASRLETPSGVSSIRGCGR